LGPNSQLGPTMSLRFPTTGLSQLGNKNTGDPFLCVVSKKGLNLGWSGL
jgi:hypothetical protein